MMPWVGSDIISLWPFKSSWGRQQSAQEEESLREILRGKEQYVGHQEHHGGQLSSRDWNEADSRGTKFQQELRIEGKINLLFVAYIQILCEKSDDDDDDHDDDDDDEDDDDDDSPQELNKVVSLDFNITSTAAGLQSRTVRLSGKPRFQHYIYNGWSPVSDCKALGQIFSQLKTGKCGGIRP
ncbi:hypothetical protein ElyMa_004906400 [Elysia marginata]|uniref:Uncharacterized protein n=1 Tax=Elysia marginata TaxID=1093978 RepID=A0AAV4IWQ3_9GAST|nr:hypothetical protein ElyMa_004906400 [Elysia marginata]